MNVIYTLGDSPLMVFKHLKAKKTTKTKCICAIPIPFHKGHNPVCLQSIKNTCLRWEGHPSSDPIIEDKHLYTYTSCSVHIQQQQKKILLIKIKKFAQTIHLSTKRRHDMEPHTQKDTHVSLLGDARLYKKQLPCTPCCSHSIPTQSIGIKYHIHYHGKLSI